MITSIQFIKNVLKFAAIEFKKIGWVEQKTGIFALRLSENAYGCVVLNKAIRRGSGILAINPIVGVGDLQLEKLFGEMIRLKFQPCTTVAIGANIGYLMTEKKYRTWQFRQEDDWQPLVIEMVATVEKFGRPFIEDNSRLTKLYETMMESKRGVPPDQLDYRIATAAVLLGKNEEAKAFIEVTLREIGIRDDLAAVQYRGFAEKLCEMLKSLG